ncbi:MAG: hypothetical protein QNK37_22750 [Acidobacteriota bacterium]|nr:hypothetical protein [Acidobacteriota bacterium]
MLAKTHARGTVLLCLLSLFTPAFADKPHTSQKLLVPHFQVSTQQGNDQTTRITLGNSGSADMVVMMELCTNWGIPVLQVPLELGPRQIRHFDLADVLNTGALPDHAPLSAVERSDLREALQGQPAQGSGLYHGSATQPGFAVGFVSFTVIQENSPYLWGRYSIFGEKGELVTNDPMLNIDMTDPTRETCQRHGMRVFFEGMETVDAQMIVWTDFTGTASELNRQQTNNAQLSAWTEDGDFIRSWGLDLMATNRFDIKDFMPVDASFWFELNTQGESHMALRMENVCDELEIHAWCLRNEGLRIEKTTNTYDADQAPGPELPVGDTVTWEYTVTNLGELPLFNVLVTDDQGVQVDCPQDSLQPGKTMVCRAQGKVEPCQYANLGTVTGRDENGAVYEDEDPSHYFGVESPSIRVEKFLNDLSCDNLPDNLEPGSVTWRFDVTNTGNVPLTNIRLIDAEAGVNVELEDLNPNQTFTVTESGEVSQGEHRNTAEVTATSPCGAAVSDRDSCRYCFSCANINLEKYTNGEDADNSPGPIVDPNSDVVWTYLVNNNGSVTLTDVTVTDETESKTFGPITLEPGQFHTFTLEGKARDDCDRQYSNLAVASATTPSGDTVTDRDQSHYKTESCEPTLTLKKKTNGIDTGRGPGPELNVGDTVTWTYEVSIPDKPTSSPLTNVTIVDFETDKTFGPIDLAVGQSFTFRDTGTVVCGEYSNTARAEGQVPNSEATASDKDISHYVGVSTPSLDLEKFTNGEDTEAPGISLPVGSEVTWSYVVTNNGACPLNDIIVEDKTEKVTFGPISLEAGDYHTFTHKGIVECGPYTNIAVATGTDASGNSATATDAGHYTGVSKTTLSLEKFTNDQNADAAPGPTLNEGDTVTWTYVVANTGSTTLEDVMVTDITEGIEFGPISLAPDGEHTFTHTGIAQCGQYSNLAEARATDVCGNELTAGDQSHYYVDTKNCAAIDLEKSTNNEDADSAPGPSLTVGDSVTWTYVVKNIGSVALSGVTVVDETENISFGPISLGVGQSQTFTHQGTVQCGLYRNLAVATGEDPENNTVIDKDNSHYTGGGSPSIELEKATDDQDADSAPGPTLTVGEMVTWTYEVTNTGPCPLNNVTVTDQTENVSFGPVTLDAGESKTFTHQGTVQCGPYSNTAVATGVDDSGNTAGDSDTSHYTGGGSPSINLEKATNDVDADTAPGPSIDAGQTVTWTYVVSNTGSCPLTNVRVEDETENVSFGPITLEAGDSKTFTHQGTAQCGPYSNTATATGEDGFGNTVSDTDKSHYTGGNAVIDLEKSTDDHDADSAPGPSLIVGEKVTWTYVVSNKGSCPLSNVTVVDQTESKTFGPVNLAAGESKTFTHEGTVKCGSYSNTAVATGSDGFGNTVSDTDKSHYTGQSNPALNLEKHTNEIDADTAPGPTLKVGETVTWTYTVTNTGNVRLEDIQVTDVTENKSFNKISLDPSDSYTFTHRGTVRADQYANTAEAEATGPCGTKVTDEDVSHYFGGGCNSALKLEKSTNDVDADNAPGPSLQTGETVTWTYTVTNTGDSDLEQVRVVDTTENISFGPITLAPRDSHTFTHTGTARCGQYRNEARAEAKDVCGKSLSDNDSSHYLGTAGNTALSLKQMVNQTVAETQPGPTIDAGDTVTWTYEVKNTGATTLTNITVTDQAAGKTFGPVDLAPGHSKTFTRTSTAECGQHSSRSEARADDACGGSLSATSVGHYTGKCCEPNIDLEKFTNGRNADSAPGPKLNAGDVVTWKYVVENTCECPLTNVTVYDEEEDITFGPIDLEPNETKTFTHKGVAKCGQYSNKATAEGTGPDGTTVTDTDWSHYKGKCCEPNIDLEKYTNDKDVRRQPGPNLKVGDKVTWKYVVENTCECPLTNVTVHDEEEDITFGPIDLKPGKSKTFTHEGVVQCGQYSNKAVARGEGPDGTEVTDSDWSHYKGIGNSAIDLEKHTNGHDADQAPGPYLQNGKTVTWTYEVTNTGNTRLTDIYVTDEEEDKTFGPIELGPDQSHTFTLEGRADRKHCDDNNQYRNKAVVRAKDPCGKVVGDEDLSHYKWKAKEDDDDDDDDDDKSGGCSPGYWKKHLNSWKNYRPKDKISKYFPAIEEYPSISNKKMWQAMGLGGGSGSLGAAKKLLSHAVPALLNAAHPDVDYAMSTSEIKTQVNDALASENRIGMLALKKQLDRFNNAGCELD